MLPPSTPLRGLPFAAVDFEATDFPGPDAHVVEVAIVHGTLGLDAPDPVVAYRSLVRPPVPIPPRVTQVHGIDDARVADAPAFADVINEMWAATEGRAIVAYNAPADFDFWSAEMVRLNDDPPPWPWLDALVVRKAVVELGASGKLRELAEARGIILDAHGAAGDAMCLALMLDRMMRDASLHTATFRRPGGARGAWLERKGFGRDPDPVSEEPAATWGDFVRWQRAAALWHEREFCAYRLRERDRNRPRCDWHRIEGEELPEWPAPPAPTMRIGQDGRVERIGGAS